MKTFLKQFIDAWAARPSLSRGARHLACLLVVLATFPTVTLGAEVRLGVLMDVPEDERSSAFVERLADEVRKTLGASNVLRLEDADVQSVDWECSEALTQYHVLSGRCDVIVLIGSGVIHKVVAGGTFPCPTLGLRVFEPQIQGIPFEEPGISGEKNFSYVLTSQDLAKELELFRRVTPFRNLTLLFSRRFARLFEGSSGRHRALEERLGVSVDVAFLTEDIEASLDGIPDATDAVYVWTPYGMDTVDLERVAAYLIENRLPSFAANRAGVDAGLMGCLGADNGLAQVLRKLAIMIDDATGGEDLATMPVAINYREEFYLNGNTMRRIGVSPPFELLFTAHLVEPLRIESTTYGVRSLIESALVENLDLKMSKLDVSLAGQEYRTAWSQYLPSVDLSSSYSAVNEEQTSALTGQAERMFAGSAELHQLVFSEDASANIRIQSHLRDAEVAANDQVALDVILGVFDEYFHVLYLKTNVAIYEENLALSRKNRELARVRVSLGASNRADLFRWESEVAGATQNVIEAHLALNVARRALNNLLNGTLEKGYSIDDESIDGELYGTLSRSLIAGQLDGPDEFGRLVDFLTEETQRRNPSKRQVEAQLLAIERRHTLNKRRFFVPTISVGASLDEVFERTGAGSAPPEGTSFTDDSWSAAVKLTLPLFDGNRRSIDLRTTRLERSQLEHERDDLNQRLSLAVLSATTDLLTASTSIGFSQISAENTEKNFVLLQENYSQGEISLLDVLDAQTAAVRAKQAYAVSVYEYVTAFMALESLLGEYGLLAAPEDRQAFGQRFDAFVAKQEGQ